MGFEEMQKNIKKEFDKYNSDIKMYCIMSAEYIKLKNEKNCLEKVNLISDLKKNLDKLKCSRVYKINRYLQIAYPGYKTKFKNNKIIYDYRVDYITMDMGRKVAVSHPAIILDLYNKVLQRADLAKRWKEFLIDVAYNGENTNLKNFEDLNKIKYLPPSQELINTLNSIFTSMNKPYLSKTNLKFNFTLEELKYLISWIALQEDINYPIYNGSKLQGRKMPFYRYIEAVFLASNKNKDGEQTLESVIKRAIEHNQPNLWEPSIDYSEIKKIEK